MQEINVRNFVGKTQPGNINNSCKKKRKQGTSKFSQENREHQDFFVGKNAIITSKTLPGKQGTSRFFVGKHNQRMPTLR